jgi:GR25 family glycosyltransferase involved in LPS biosynthesis
MSKDTARLQHFQKTFAESDLSPLGFTRIEAINGRLVNIPTIVSRRALSEMLIAEKLGYRSRHYHITRGSVGCFLSHQKTWQSILDTNAPAGLIFEDDATLTPSLLGRLKTMRIPLDYDIILLGHWCHACQVIGQSSDVLRVRSWFGLHGYIIHQRGIKKILNNPNFLPIRKQVDLQLSEMAASGDLIVYALKQQLVRQNNEEFMTTIQTPMKKVPGQDPFDPN